MTSYTGTNTYRLANAEYARAENSLYGNPSTLADYVQALWNLHREAARVLGITPRQFDANLGYWREAAVYQLTGWTEAEYADELADFHTKTGETDDEFVDAVLEIHLYPEDAHIPGLHF
jgi:hypothetical protein